MRRLSVTPILVVCTLAALTAACGKNGSQMLPTAASPVDATSALAAPAGNTAAVIDRSSAQGTVVRDAAAVAQWTAENWTFDLAADLQVEGSGPIGSVTGSCPSVVLNIYGIDVEVNAATSFPIGSACGGLAPGRVVRIRGLLYLVGGAMRVLATDVTIEGGVNRPVEGEGVLTDLSGSCPARTLTVRGVNVTLGGGTTVRWRNGTAGTCDQLQVGQLVYINAEITPAGSIIASRVTIQNGNPPATPPTNTTPTTPTTPTPPPPPRPNRPHEPLSGTISNRAGSCPVVSMKVAGHTARTSSSTSYDGGTCTDLLNGVNVELHGTENSEGQIDVTTVIVVAGAHIEGSGAITSVSGACPALTFGAFNQTFRTGSDTVYSRGTCDGVRLGRTVTVRGVKIGSYVKVRSISID